MTLKTYQVLTQESIEKIERAIEKMELIDKNKPELTLITNINDLKEIVNDCKE